MPVVMPFDSSSPNYRVGTTLEDVTYIFDVRWNERDSSWYFDLYTVDEVLVRGGMKLALGAAPGRRSVDDNFPPGVFWVFDTSNRGEDAGVDDLGDRVIVLYYPEDEVVYE